MGMTLSPGNEGYTVLKAIETAVESSATLDSSIYGVLAGDLVASRGGSAPTTYPANDAAGAGASYTPFLGTKPVLVEVENLDSSNYIDVCPDDGTGTYGYLVIGTPGTDAVFIEYKTAGDITYQAEILVSGNNTALSVTETSSKITINSATSAIGAATSTPEEIAAYINSTMNSGAGSSYVYAYANGASAVSAAAAASLAGDADAGAAARKLKMDYTPTFYRSYIHRIPAGSKMAFSLKTGIQGMSIKANTSAVVYQLRAYA